MTTAVILLVLWGVFAPIATYLIGNSRAVAGDVDIDGHIHPILNAVSAPHELSEHLDELLVQENGEFVPAVPPIFVPKGVSPVAYSHKMRRETGKIYHSRRVEG